jgi:ATP-binding cassette subfamily A (ABC1) protein 3
LGHNGAGKTSTISMLTGLLEITKGDVIGYGLDVKT